MGLRKSLLIASTALVLPCIAAASASVPDAPLADAAALHGAQGSSDLHREAKHRRDWWSELLAGEEGGEWGEEGEEGGEWG
ncbi:MAG TPA: hypothetical protein VJL84_08535, partial [Kiloniellales bacterium]|nr:hypothetical protein [Kiloniellales bacterium]